ncbi:hypothetical protein BO71DRAFT_102121 [Aspergillus ellipticus CBS 707.79]|uniref:Uncharacterized protein n=1 Tax=Aspergillus ellipticus CBS 707.79 TaxID=1448320 RepID=A0A319DJX3_9EURO|nr:hypothetical protein BO71DRAFT_102121 [Aspergillus ellipticus CBS 707.79]
MVFFRKDANDSDHRSSIRPSGLGVFFQPQWSPLELTPNGGIERVLFKHDSGRCKMDNGPSDSQTFYGTVTEFVILNGKRAADTAVESTIPSKKICVSKSYVKICDIDSQACCRYRSRICCRQEEDPCFEILFQIFTNRGLYALLLKDAG